MTEKDASRRWTLAIAQLRNRAARLRRAGAAGEPAELLEQALTLCDEMVRELAGAGLQLEEYRSRLHTQSTLWAHLFEEMPAACVETDASGIIVDANRTAATLLNTSVKHLSARLLMHFAEDRDQFGQLLRDLSSQTRHHSCSLIVRPRERAPVRVDATVIPRTPGDGSSWLWFLSPIELYRPNTRHDRSVATASGANATLD